MVRSDLSWPKVAKVHVADENDDRYEPSRHSRSDVNIPVEACPTPRSAAVKGEADVRRLRKDFMAISEEDIIARGWSAISQQRDDVGIAAVPVES